MVTAAGLLLVPEGAGGCSCSYNFQTCIALAPVKDGPATWFALQGVAPTARVKHLHLNLGAPGDRHAADGTAWLAVPRPAMQRAAPVPVEVDAVAPDWYYEPAGPALQQFAKPWLFSSGLRGAARLTVELQQRPQLLVPLRTEAPEIDGKLNDPAWQDLQTIPLELQGYPSMPRLDLKVYRDAKNLYIAYRRDDATRRGVPVTNADKPWAASGARPLKDEYVKIYPTDTKLKRIVEYVVGRSGARSDSLYRPGDKKGDNAWQGKWRSKVTVEGSQWTAELAIPLADLSDAGLDPKALLLNVSAANFSGIGPRELWLTRQSHWPLGRSSDFRKVVAHRPDPGPPHPYTIRLYFASPIAVVPRAGRFDVRIQGERVLEDFDIAAASAGTAGGVIKTFRDVPLTDRLTVELVPKSHDTAAENAATNAAPLWCGLEVIDASGK